MAGRTPVRRVLAVAAVALSALSLILWIWRESVISRRHHRFVQLVADLREETDRIEVRRPPLGDPLPGDAGEEHRLLLKGLKGPAPPYYAIPKVRLFGGTAQATEDWLQRAERYLADNGAGLECIRRSARRSEVLPDYADWIPAFIEPGRAPPWRRELRGLIYCRVVLLGEADRARDAAQAALEGCRLGCDGIRQGGFMQAAHCAWLCSMVQGDLQAILSSRALAPADFREIERGLELLDASFPAWGDVLLREARMIGTDLLEGDLREWFGPVVPGWRFAFSRRLAEAAAMEWLRGAVLRLRSAELGPWSDLWKLEQEFGKEAVELGRTNPVLARIAPQGWLAEQHFRERRATLRLLRLLAHERATGEMLDLEDPFGGRLRATGSGESFRAWSAGRDGVDDGGDAQKDVVVDTGT